jgi:hypothetical protein
MVKWLVLLSKYEQVSTKLGVKTFMQDVMDEKGQVLFDNLAWFAKKLCSVMASASACEHMRSIEGWIHNKRRNRLAQPNVEKAVRAHGNLVLRKAAALRIMFVSIFRCSSPPRNPVYARCVDPSALAFSLSSHRHSYHDRFSI